MTAWYRKSSQVIRKSNFEIAVLKAVQIVRRKLKRVVYCTNAVVPSVWANSVHIMKMASGFAANGFNTTVFAYRGRIPAQNEIHSHYGVQNNFRIALLPEIPFLRRIFGEDHISTIVKLVYIALIRPYFVYCRDLLTAWTSTMLRRNVIFETHNLPQTRTQLFMLRCLSRSSRCRAVVVISHGLAEDLKRLLPKPERGKIHIAHDGVDIDHMRVTTAKSFSREKFGLPLSETIVGHVGHMYKGRGMPIVLDLARKFPLLSFVFVGGTNRDIDHWKKEVERSGLTNCRFLGYFPNAELPLLYRSFDVLLMPYEKSVTVKGAGNTVNYMSPMKLFEYMASGVPFIASDLPVLHEVLAHEQNCLFANPDDINDWATALSLLLKNKELRDRLVFKAGNDVLNHTWQNRIKTTLKSVGIGY